MRKIAIAFAAVCALGFAAPAMAAPNATPAAPAISVQTDAVKAGGEFSSSHRHWHGHRHHHWQRHHWHRRHHHWRGHRHWGPRHCWHVWRHGHRVRVCR